MIDLKPFAAAFVLFASLSLLSALPARAQEAPKSAAKTDMPKGGCDSYTWDVSHELNVLGKPAKPINAGTDGKKPVHLELDQHYAVKLAPQASVQFVQKPGKPTLDDSAQAGVFSFRTPKPGRYRISITTGHWLDVLDGPLVVVSSDFQGQRGCEKAHKIVQYELSGNRDFVLQLSGGTEAKLDLAITPVSG